MSTLLEFMADRANKIAKGHLGYNRALVALNNLKKKNECHDVAGFYSRSNKSDPFAFKRALSHLLNGASTMPEYSNKMLSETGETAISMAFKKVMNNIEPPTIAFSASRAVPFF